MSAIIAMTAAPVAKLTRRLAFSTSAPPRAMPQPRPLTMNVEDHVNASVAYLAGARRETRTA
jgi:hypothetical protein